MFGNMINNALTGTYVIDYDVYIKMSLDTLSL